VTEDVSGSSTSSRGLVELADHGTDAAAIAALVVLGIYGDPSWELVGTIASIAVGKNYLRSRGS